MKVRTYFSVTIFALGLCLITMMPTGVSQPDGQTAVVNLMIDADVPVSPSMEEIETAKSNLMNMSVEIQRRGLKATVYLPKDLTATQASLIITHIGRSGRHEFAISGNSLDERLSNMPYSEQKTILESSKEFAEACYVCGEEKLDVTGFKPQSFDQNENTYRALDELGIEYNAGFQAGLLYAPGHEDDVWPYRVEGHGFYAVPLSTYNLEGERVPLQDRHFKDEGLSSSQWYAAMVSKFDEASANGEPVVVLLTTSISGSGEYLDAYKRFLDYGMSRDASFVNTNTLVDMSRTGVYDLQDLEIALAENDDESSSGCPECDNDSIAFITAVSTNETETEIAQGAS